MAVYVQRMYSMPTTRVNFRLSEDLVERADLADTLARDDAGVAIATSRHGTPLTLGRLERLSARIADDGCTVAFGAPGRGLPEICDAQRGADGVVDVELWRGDDALYDKCDTLDGGQPGGRVRGRPLCGRSRASVRPSR